MRSMIKVDSVQAVHPKHLHDVRSPKSGTGRFVNCNDIKHLELMQCWHVRLSSGAATPLHSRSALRLQGWREEKAGS
ncbi:unnamed protein product [Mycena citricolor]|uniref:Uncharacterized protein n=1 Tax=Mycena citricolor TaxID=2018698 RepID=A0AAD2JZ77_9AGAR|nr:unnamed protein product [Mycena citricolor]